MRKSTLGVRSGKLVVVDEYWEKGIGWSVCDCDCGNKGHIAYSQHIRSGRTSSCGCVRKGNPNFKPCYPKGVIQVNVDGKRYGRLVVQHSYFKEDGKRYLWMKCDCGNEREYPYTRLFWLKTNKLGCGCQQNRQQEEMRARVGTTVNGWFIKDVVYRDKVAYYVTLCPKCGREVEKRTSVVVAENYPSSSCGTCPRARIWLTYNGRTMSQSDWAKEVGMSRERLRQRLLKYPVGIALKFEQVTKEQRIKQKQESKKPLKTVEYRGETKTVAEWAEELSIGIDALRARLRKYPPEDALNPDRLDRRGRPAKQK